MVFGFAPIPMVLRFVPIPMGTDVSLIVDLHLQGRKKEKTELLPLTIKTCLEGFRRPVKQRRSHKNLPFVKPTLPNPNQEILETLNNLFQEFEWNGPPCVKGQVILRK